MVVEHFGLASDAVYAFEGCIEAPTFCFEKSEKMNPTLDPSPIFSIGEGTFGDPKGRYCANLGHKVDDESGLVYMRARYYDPTSGRFISEDVGCDGLNWFSYAKNNPIGGIDSSGNAAAPVITALLQIFSAWIGGLIGYCAISFLFESLFPGYKAASIMGISVTGFIGAVGNTFLLTGTKDGAGLLGKSITEMAKTIKNSISQTGLDALGEAGGIAFLVGLICGALGAVIEFVMSPQWADL